MQAQLENPEYEVLSPWAEADPKPLQGISTRIDGLAGKTLGLFYNSKRASSPTLSVVREKLLAVEPTLSFSSFLLMPNAGVDETEDKDRFDDWVKEVDAVIMAYGD
jgi:hypothetical protein